MVRTRVFFITLCLASLTATSFGQESQWVELKMFGIDTGWGIDVAGTVFRRTAQTTHWQEVTPLSAGRKGGANKVLSCFLDMQHAWVVYDNDGIPPDGALDGWHTTDGGKNWQKIGALAPQPRDIIEVIRLVEIFFVDANHGWVFGQIYPGMSKVYPLLYATSDGGTTWQTVSEVPPRSQTDKPIPGSYSLSFGKPTFMFITPRIGFAGGNHLYKTQDGGQRWEPQELPKPANFPAIDSPYIYIFPPQFSTPYDGVFESWVFDFDDVYCPPCDTFSALPASLDVYVTSDGGQTWIPQPAPGPVGMVGMVDTDTIWFLGQQKASFKNTTLYFSHDKGQSWTVQAQQPALPLGTKLDFLDEQRGFAYNPFVGVGRGFDMVHDDRIANAAGPAPYFYFTLDAGATWRPFPTAP